MARRNKPINLPAPYLRRIWLEPARVTDPKAYPFCLPFLAKGFDLSFDRAVTIVVGENGVGKSTLLEGIAALAGYDQAGGARDTCRSIIPTRSMFQAPTFRMRCGQAGCPKSPRVGSSARRVFSRSRAISTRSGALERISSRIRTVKDFCDSSRSAVSGRASICSTSRNRYCRRTAAEFLKLLRRMDESSHCQVIMATHSPILMAYPGAALLRLAKYGLEPVTVQETDHYRVMREFCADPAGFVEAMMDE
jgi:predicted ATPase